jgi:hypothetical protein
MGGEREGGSSSTDDEDAGGDDDAVRCIVVLGDRAARRGIELFEQQMVQAGFKVLESDCQPLMSEYTYSWHPAND